MAQGRAGIMGKSLIIRNPSISEADFFWHSTLACD